MTDNAVRIGRVRPKAGGDIHVLAVDPRTEVQQGILESALDLIDLLPDMAGYALVAWDDTGTPYCHTWVLGDADTDDREEQGPISLYLLTSFVHDTLMLHILEEEAADLFFEDEP